MRHDICFALPCNNTVVLVTPLLQSYVVFHIMSSNLNVISHPVVAAHLTKLRQETTSPKEFREGIHNLSLILGIEASRTLESKPVHGKTPIGPFTGTVIKPRIGLAPILRAGSGMTDALLSLFPDAPVYHLGLFREKVTLQPVIIPSYLLIQQWIRYSFSTL